MFIRSLMYEYTCAYKMKIYKNNNNVSIEFETQVCSLNAHI